VCDIDKTALDPVFDLDRGLNFSNAQIKRFLPRPEVYREDSLRAVVAEVLLSDEIFNFWRNSPQGQDLTFRRVLEVFCCKSKILNDEFSMPDIQLRRLIEGLMMVCSYLYAEGPLTHLLRTDDVREVMFNGHNDCWVEIGNGLQMQNSPFSSWNDLRSWLDHHASKAGREVVTDRGCSDFALQSGARVHVALSPLARDSGYVSIRRHRDSSCSLDSLEQQGSLSSEQRNLLEASVKDKKNILLAGATSSGKTTLVRALAECVSSQERIVVLEDVPELRIAHPHCVYLQTIEAGQGEAFRPMSLDDLLREALRMRPDRLIVGECRGHEAFALIQALHTGHRGSFSTVHANSAADALKRLEALLIRAEPSLSGSVVRNLIAGAFDVIVFLERTQDLRRCVSGVHRVEDLLCEEA
jgi:pilus assembly protein CpaF